MKKLIYTLFILMSVQSISSAQIFRFNFEDTDDVTIDNAVGTPAFIANGTNSNQYFTGYQDDCSGTASGTKARSARSWQTGDSYQFNVNTTDWNDMTFSFCFRTSNAANTGSWQVRGSINGGSSWENIGAEFDLGSNNGSSLISVNRTLSVTFEDQADVTIQIYKVDDSVSDPAIRIDNALLEGTTLLPVELVDFNVQKIKESIRLDWKTQSETNNDYFIIERSTDARDFKEVGMLDGKGTSFVAVEYNFIDESPLAGTNYYRLRQVDFDGTTDFSNILQITFESGHEGINDFTMYPTLVSGDSPLTINFRNQYATDISISIFNLNGQLISSYLTEEVNNYEIPTSQLNSGLYLLRLSFNNTILTKRFVKK